MQVHEDGGTHVKYTEISFFVLIVIIYEQYSFLFLTMFSCHLCLNTGENLDLDKYCII